MKRVLILGRPNVGKSSLFNRLIRQKKALVINRPGLTRDILTGTARWWGEEFEVSDSGGLWQGEKSWDKRIYQKILSALSETDFLIFVMEGPAGLRDEDKQIFRLIKKSAKPFLTLVNKMDGPPQGHNTLLSEFCELGLWPRPCAFEKDQGISETVEWVLSQATPPVRKRGKKLSHPQTRVFVMGKTNVGKSSLCNALLKQDRMISSPEPGTTRDVVEEGILFHQHLYNLCDSAGLRKARLLQNKTDSLSWFKTHQSFKQSDMVWLLMDGTQGGPGRQESKLLKMCAEHHKAVLLVVNKWDLAQKKISKKAFREKTQEVFHFYPDLKMVFTSALKPFSGLGVLLRQTDFIRTRLGFRVSTGVLNRFFHYLIQQTPPPVHGTRDVKFYYLTQTGTDPPSFVCFANYPGSIPESYKRFLIRRMQKKWDLKGLPVRIRFVPKKTSA